MDLRAIAASSIRENRLLLVLVGAYLVAAWVVAGLYGIDLRFRLYSRVWFASAALLYWSLLLIATGAAALRAWPTSLSTLLPNLYLRRWRLPERIGMALPVFLILPPMFAAYTSIKHAIPTLNPTFIDAVLIDLDVALHGRHPWELLQPVFGSVFATEVIDTVYLSWFVVKFAIVSLVAGWLSRTALRRQYLLTFAVTWIVLGTISAILFASVGPCYLSIFVPGEAAAFAPLMDGLRAIDVVHDLFSIGAQDLLLSDHQAAAPGFGRGISAMPSLHVAIAMLNAILGWKLSRLWGALATVYLAAILLGSVHLGWHYAVDGYFSMIAVSVIWVLVGRFVHARGAVALQLTPREAR